MRHTSLKGLIYSWGEKSTRQIFIQIFCVIIFLVINRRTTVQTGVLQEVQAMDIENNLHATHHPVYQTSNQEGHGQMTLTSSSKSQSHKVTKSQPLTHNDTLRNKNPNTPGYTWSNGTICSRIDFLLTTKNILVSDAAVTPVFFSDHSKIDCTITCHVKAHQGICRNHRDEFTTFYYLHNIFLLPTRHQAAGRGVCKAPLTTYYKV